MFSCTKLISVASVALAGLATAAPAPVQGMEKRSYSGQATYYATGLGACGWSNSDSEHVVAMNAAQYDSGSWCGKSITITNTELGKSTTATVVDQCPGCAYGSLDMSQSLFSDLSNNNLAEGVFPISWS